jgi:hypothetical protein
MKMPDRPLTEWWADRGGRDAASLAATRDVAELLSVSRERVGQLLRSDPTFPRPFNEQFGRIWWRAGVEAWIAVHRLVRARPDNPFRGEAAEVIRLAEAEAIARCHSYVGTWHVWLALARPEAPGAVRDVFGSLGVDVEESRRAATFGDAPGDVIPRSHRMNPRTQDLLGRAVRVAQGHDGIVLATDLAIGWIDGDETSVGHRRTRGATRRFRRDPVLQYLERRGLDVDEFRRRLVAARDDPAAAAAFDVRALPKRRPARPAERKPDWLDLAPNPLGHDPWERRPWGSAFAIDKNDQMLKVDGEQWFFDVDRDGFFVRTRDGRPVGYRWPHPPRRHDGPVNGFLEVLPRPPASVAYWPHHRYPRDA